MVISEICYKEEVFPRKLIRFGITYMYLYSVDDILIVSMISSDKS